MGSCKRSCNKTIQGGRLRELLAESMAYVVGYQYCCVNNNFLLNNISLPITGEVRVCTGQRTISAYVLYYSKFDQEVKAFMKVLTEWSLTRT